MLLPTTGTTYKVADILADPVRLNSNLGAYTNFVNLMDLAALAIPAGVRADTLPFGVTLVGPVLSDGKLAVIGDALHRTLCNAKLGATSIALTDTPVVVAVGPQKKRIELAANR
jgi:allophanate hydrolase